MTDIFHRSVKLERDRLGRVKRDHPFDPEFSSVPVSRIENIVLHVIAVGLFGLAVAHEFKIWTPGQ